MKKGDTVSFLYGGEHRTGEALNVEQVTEDGKARFKVTVEKPGGGTHIATYADVETELKKLKETE